MVRDIITRIARMCNRNDIIFEVGDAESVSEIDDANIKNDVVGLIDLYNAVAKLTFQSYFKLIKKDLNSSNSACQIPYYTFSSTPISILAVEGLTGENIRFKAGANSIKLASPNQTCYVTYSYCPDDVSDLADETGYGGVYENLIIYGVLSRYFISKGRLTEGKSFEDIFLRESFLLNSKRERRLKSTFCL